MQRKIKLKSSFIKIILLIVFFSLVGTFVVQSYSRYESRAKLNANIDKAIYLLKDEKMTFNLDPDAIYPNDTPYVYRFTVSNFDGAKEGDFDLEYYIIIRTTTNIPITVRLFRNEEFSSSATNLLTTYQLIQDDENTWYKEYNKTSTYTFLNENRTTDSYVLVVDYPKIYSSYKEYAGVPENIEVGIYSKQKI